MPELLPERIKEIKNPEWKQGADQPEYISITEHLEDFPEVLRVWDRYLEEQWIPWVEDHNVWESIHKVYTKLFAIHQEQLRFDEEYELILGLGLLTWKTPSGQRVRRHLIVADAVLEFEARLGKFTVCSHPEGAKLRPELDMLDIEEQPINAEETAKVSLAESGDDPWDKDCIESVLKTLVHSINSQGEYDESLKKKDVRASDKPIVEYAPALILRKRSIKSLTETIRRIRERIKNGDDIPIEFADLSEIRTEDGRESDDDLEKQSRAFDGEIFFPKPSNEEQRRIVEKLRSATGVLVQGPPGTGKSHTIANLISHLLATGQRTLITAKTPRALQVLERLMPEELRPLCINLLGSGPEELRSLEVSVSAILSKNEEWSEDHAKREQAELEKRLQYLREEQAKVDRRILDIRESETHKQVIAEGKYQGTAAYIAKAVNRDKPQYDWFIDRINYNDSCPFNPDELLSLLKELRYFTPAKQEELNLYWPEALPSQDEFARLIQEKQRTIKQEKALKVEADDQITEILIDNNPESVKTLQEALFAFIEARKRLTLSTYHWMTEALRDVLYRNSTLWKELARVTKCVIASVEPLVELADNNSVEIPDSTDIMTLYEDALKLKKYLENGGNPGWGPFRPKTVKECIHVIKTVRISGHSPSNVEQFSVLCNVLRVRIELEKAWNFWKKWVDKTPGPYALQLMALKSMYNALEDVLSLENLIEQCSETIHSCIDISEPDWSDEFQIEKLITSCRLAQVIRHKQSISEKLQDIETQISSITNNNNVHPVTIELMNAIRNRDLDGFAKASSKIQELKEDRQRLQEMDKYLSRLSRWLPGLTDELKLTCNEPYWDARFQHIGDAWCWAQARHWIEEYIKKEDLPALEKRARQIVDEINETITKLASIHAWSFCFSRLKEDHRRHMEAWQQSMRRLGKGTGKHAPRHRREAQQHLNQCREAVPAWVMPLHRVWDTIDPAPGMFDVIIVDEASQCGLKALPLFYLGKKILIVGDDRQISPEAVGLPRDAVHRLMEEFLYDFSFKSSFDVESSLFDHGKLRHGTQRITLREHFRCMPEIIRFSNDLCYSDTPLIPLRQYGPDRLPPLKHTFIEGGHKEGSYSRAINRPEANAIVEKIVELCSDDRYAKKTMGVVVLQGNAQAGLIEDLLLKELGAEEMERRRLICGNPYSFQGDERDVIFLSMVAAINERIGPLTKAADERRFNVAASRARDQMWLFHSVRLEDLSEKDLRRKLLEFFLYTKPQQVAGIDRNKLERRAKEDNRSLVKPPAPFESWFEVDVALELLRKGFSVTPQFEVAGKRIDLVVEGGHARLAIECDGDYWHGVDRYEEDVQRQRQLERCGWEFFRIRESAFYANKDYALRGLWPMLEERVIFPNIDSISPYIRNTTNNLVFDNSNSDKSLRSYKSDAVASKVKIQNKDLNAYESPNIGKDTARKKETVITINGVRFKGSTVRELYYKVLKYLCDNGYISKVESSIPLATSSRRYLLAKKPIHQGGNQFKSPIEYKGYFMEAHKNYKTAFRHLQQLINKCGLTMSYDL